MSQIGTGKEVVDTVIGHNPAKERVAGSQNGLASPNKTKRSTFNRLAIARLMSSCTSKTSLSSRS
jgi:2-keto-4-pentenoate hydratase